MNAGKEHDVDLIIWWSHYKTLQGIHNLIPRRGEGGFSYANFIKLPVNGWFAHDVTVTMLVDKNKSICLLWVLNSIFMLLKILLFWPNTSTQTKNAVIKTVSLTLSILEDSLNE